jgi:hypothetical protein
LATMRRNCASFSCELCSVQYPASSSGWYCRKCGSCFCEKCHGQGRTATKSLLMKMYDGRIPSDTPVRLKVVGGDEYCVVGDGISRALGEVNSRIERGSILETARWRMENGVVVIEEFTLMPIGAKLGLREGISVGEGAHEGWSSAVMRPDAEGRVRCPYCGRRHPEAVARRHIPLCARWARDF